MALPSECDLLIVGGGINGAGIARDAAGQGLSVVLCERDDLAAHTSSASSKLIHGGLRYLEYREFGLVRKALREREVLLRMAPHLIAPLSFVMPHAPGMRPAWMIRAGLFLYDHLARRELLAGSATIDLRRHPAGVPLQPSCTRAFTYADGWVDDARLVLANAVDARERGAGILVGTACTALRRQGGAWEAELGGTAPQRLRARAVVNAAGPWAGSFARLALGEHAPALRLVKGSHVVVPRLFEHDQAYILQQPDRRIVFALPFHGAFTLIGTTDTDYQGDPAAAVIDEAERDYLCAAVNRYFRRRIGPADIVHTFSGVRPLLDSGEGSAAALTRDYRLELDADGPPLLHVWGGKITTYRKLAEEALGLLGPHLGLEARAWTGTQALPGGDLAATGAIDARADFAAFLERTRTRWPWLPAGLARQLAHRHGSRMERVLGDAASLAGLGPDIAPGLYERELAYMAEHEWACSADDVLWRRTKQGLFCTAADAQAVGAWLNENRRAGMLTLHG
ncbi:MAG TPA: glycerol-3-phosphate dehydrogenase [Telluria sp.]|nr:glycerol-3-phosphate dehydrogenase [Telluria sp.]